MRERTTAPPRCDGAHEATIIIWAFLYAHAISKQRATTQRRRRINREDCDTSTFLTRAICECANECALPRTWRTGDADHTRSGTCGRCKLGERLLDQRVGARASALHTADRLRELSRTAQGCAARARGVGHWRAGTWRSQQSCSLGRRSQRCQPPRVQRDPLLE